MKIIWKNGSEWSVDEFIGYLALSVPEPPTRGADKNLALAALVLSAVNGADDAVLLNCREPRNVFSRGDAISVEMEREALKKLRSSYL